MDETAAWHVFPSPFGDVLYEMRFADVHLEATGLELRGETIQTSNEFSVQITSYISL